MSELNNNKRRLNILKEYFAVCSLAELPDIPQGIFFLSRTKDEISLVCEERYIPEAAKESERGWRALRVEGILDFSLTGVLSELSGALAWWGISLFALSTYNTDYILVRKDSLKAACAALSAKGWIITGEI